MREHSGAHASDDLRRRLLDAAVDLLREPDTPLDLRKVAERAGKSRTAPYLAFGKGPSGGVMALRIAVAAEGARLMAEAMVAAQEDTGGREGDPFETLQSVAAAFLAFVEKNPRLFRLMYGPEISAIAGLGEGGFREHPEFRSLLAWRDQAGAVVTRLIHEAQDRELLHVDPPSGSDAGESVAHAEVPSLRYLQIAWAAMIGVSVLRNDELLRAIGWDLSIEQGARVVAESLLGVDPARAEEAMKTFLEASDLAVAAAKWGAAERAHYRERGVLSAELPSHVISSARALLGDESLLEEQEPVRRRAAGGVVGLRLSKTHAPERGSGSTSLSDALDRHSGLRRAAYSPALRGARLLWIDDHPDWVARIADSLRSLGASVTVVPDTKEAVAHLEAGGAGEARVEVIVSDIARGSDPQAGTDAIPRLRAVAPAVPIVFNISDYDPARGVPEGAFGITNRLDELFHLILDALERRKR